MNILVGYTGFVGSDGYIEQKNQTLQRIKTFVSQEG